MEDHEQLSSQVQIRGRDLPGAVNVLPLGLSEVLAKRESKEVHVEQSFSNTTYSSGLKSGSQLEQNFYSSEKSYSNTFASTTKFESGGLFGQKHETKEEHHGEEIRQESLKSTLQAAITDIEEQIDYEADKENHPTLQSHENQESHSGEGVARRFKFPHEFKGRPQSQPEYNPSDPLDLPEVGSSSKKIGEEEMAEREGHSGNFNGDHKSYQIQTASENGVVHEENFSSQKLEQNMISGKSSTILDKIMTPCADFDSNSLKRRNPRQMFTDSSFYSPKFHPSVADQVEMAYKLSASLYEDGNKMSKGQEMYLKRMKKSGVDTDEQEELPHHDKVPNLKLVMNPEGKLHDWTDVPEDELPELQQIASGGPSAEIAHNVVENLQTCKGRGGELFAKRRKKADKWVVDETSIGSTAPSQFADHFLQQQSFQQKLFQEQQEQEKQEQFQRQNIEHENEQFERQQFQEEQKMIFRQQQMQKQQQSLEIRKQQEVEYPPDFKPYSLKSRSFTPTFDTSIHNVQGINVWANKAPKPFGQSNTLPRSATISHDKTAYAEMPEKPSQPSDVPQVAICPATPQVTEEDTFAQNQLSSISSNHCVDGSKEVVHREDLEEQKRKEYEAWFKSQEKEQQLLEYDCSVKYIEKQADHETTSQEHHYQQSVSTNLTSFKGIEKTILEEPVIATPEPDIPKSSIQQEQILLQKQQAEEELKQREQEQERLLQQQQEQERLLKQQEEQERFQQQEHERRLQQQHEQERLFQQQQEQARILQQQQEQERLFQQQQEQERLQQQEHERSIQLQLEQERLLKQQQEQEWLQQQEQKRILQHQKQEQERLLKQQQEQERFLQQQREQEQQEHFFQQQQELSYQSHSSKHQMTELHHSELSMQMKTGGLVYRKETKDSQVEDYVGSLRPTTTGAIIRTEGDVFYTQAPSFNGQQGQESHFSEVELRSTSAKKDVRQSGVFVGIFGENNALVNSSEAFDYEKHSVRSLVDHFSKAKPKNVPTPDAMQQTTPPLSYLREQAKERQFQYQEKGKQTDDTTVKNVEDNKLQELMSKRRNSLKEYLLMEFSKETSSSTSAQSSFQLLDPSAILKVDGSVTDGPRIKTHTTENSNLFIETDKWDNHNAIARGWKTVENSYHPVTFRRIYGVTKQGLKNTLSAPQLASSSHDDSLDDNTHDMNKAEVLDAEEDL